MQTPQHKTRSLDVRKRKTQHLAAVSLVWLCQILT